MIAHPTDRLLDALFDRHDVRHEDHRVVAGVGWLDGRAVAVVGTTERAYIGVETALALAGHVLDVLRDHPGRPILLVVDNSGQRLSRWDELMGNNGFIAHLTTCLDFARRRGHRAVGVVHGLAVSGGFMATGMATAACHALPGAELRVMVPDAMARITRIPLDRLLTLFETQPVLAPGADNFVRIGGLHGVWEGDPRGGLRAALDATDPEDDPRRRLGAERGGRTRAAEVAALVRAGAGA